MKLTPFAKMFIALVVAAVVGYTYFHWQKTQGGPPVADPAAAGASGAAAASGAAVAASGAGAPAPSGAPAAKPPVARDPKRIIIGVNDFGGAYPGVVANDGAAPGPKSKFAAAGLDVEIKLIRGSKERLQAFDDGEVDVMLLTLDYLANLAPIYKDKGQEVRAFLMADWSRGNLGIVAKPSIRSIEDLKTAKITTTRNTPTHYFLLSLLKKSNLSAAEVEKVKSSMIFATKTPQAGEIFQRGEADAVAIWEPHLSQCLEGDKGKLLVSTALATNLVADVLFARASFLKEHEAQMETLARVWFDGVKMLAADPDGSIATIAAAFKQPVPETKTVLAKIKPATFADNRTFFGLDRERAPYFTLYEEAARFWQKEGVIKEIVPPEQTRWTKALEAISKDFVSEKVVETFKFEGGPKKDAPALLTKSVSIYFASGSDKIDPNARKLIGDFGETLAQIGNAYVRVEGNTDDKGAHGPNVDLSKRRALAVIDLLVKDMGFDRGRFVAVGNGPDNPVGDNTTDEGREINRRTDFRILPNE